MQHDQTTLPEDQRPKKSSGKGGLQFIGMELTIFSAAILVFVIAIIVILFFALSQ